MGLTIHKTIGWNIAGTIVRYWFMSGPVLTDNEVRSEAIVAAYYIVVNRAQ